MRATSRDRGFIKMHAHEQSSGAVYDIPVHNKGSKRDIEEWDNS